jgi:hypothetical protein
VFRDCPFWIISSLREAVQWFGLTIFDILLQYPKMFVFINFISSLDSYRGDGYVRDNKTWSESFGIDCGFGNIISFYFTSLFHYFEWNKVLDLVLITLRRLWSSATSRFLNLNDKYKNNNLQAIVVLVWSKLYLCFKNLHVSFESSV